MSNEQDDKTFEEILDAVKADYTVEQFAADIAEVPVERFREYHTAVCIHIAKGATARAAINKLAAGELA